MALDFSDIDQTVNANLATQAPPAAPPSDPPDPPAPVLATPEPSELDRARAEIDQLKAEASASARQNEDRLSEERIKTAKALANKPVVRLNLGMQDAQVAQAIRSVGGNAFWHRLSIQQKADVLNVGAFASVPAKELRRYFGSGSSSADATRLGSQQPELYKQYRLLSKIHGIIG